MNKKQSKKGRSLTIFMVIIALVAVGLSGITVYAKVIQPKRYSECIKQGNQYLSENMYEEAISTFDKAIKIDDESIEARIGASKGYIGVENPTKAGNYLFEAQKLDLKNETLTLEMINIIKDTDRNIASQILQNHLNAVGNDNVSDKFKAEIFESTYNEKLVGNVETAMAMYNKAVEGYEDGNYKKGSKEELLKSIKKAKVIGEGYFYTQEEIDEMTSMLGDAIEKFESNKVILMPSNLASTYKARLQNVTNTMDRKLSNYDLCNAEMGEVVAEAQEGYEAILNDIYSDLITYLPDKKQEINSHKREYEQEVANQKYEFENMPREMVGTWMVTGIPEAFGNIAKDNAYDLINRYM